MAIDRVAGRIRDLASGYTAPDFAHVPDPDAALFLCAVDHRTGYRRAHVVAGDGPFSGSALMWAVALAKTRRRPGLLTAEALLDVTPQDVSALFRVGGESVDDPARRAGLWHDLAVGLERDHAGEARRLLTAAGGSLGAERGLVALLERYRAYSDPLGKKSFLFAKICERRGWFVVADPESWEVCADNVLMRLALRSGLVEPGPLDEVRAATRAAFKRVAELSGVSPPVLDDLLWELGRDHPDLLGAEGGDISEPARKPGSAWY